MLPGLGQQDETAVLDDEFLASRALLIRPADEFIAVLEAVARRTPEQQGDPFAIGDHDHAQRIARRAALAHVVELLGEFREKRNVLFGLYDFDVQ